MTLEEKNTLKPWNAATVDDNHYHHQNTMLATVHPAQKSNYTLGITEGVTIIRKFYVTTLGFHC